MKDIRKLREERGMSQRELARKSGLSQTGIRKIKNGQTKEPSIQTIENIAKAFNVKTSWLIS